MWQHYQSIAPGRVAVIGADVWNGTTAQMNAFRLTTGATFPLLLNAALPGGGDFLAAYGDRDDYVVIDEIDVVRFQPVTQGYVYGGRYDLPRIVALVDSLLAHPTTVGDHGGAGLAELNAYPNPFAAATTVALALGPASTHASLAVYDMAGRRVRALAGAAATNGVMRALWDGRDEHGRAVAAGVYLVRATDGVRSLTRRLVRLR